MALAPSEGLLAQWGKGKKGYVSRKGARDQRRSQLTLHSKLLSKDLTESKDLTKNFNITWEQCFWQSRDLAIDSASQKFHILCPSA